MVLKIANHQHWKSLQMHPKSILILLILYILMLLELSIFCNMKIRKTEQVIRLWCDTTINWMDFPNKIWKKRWIEAERHLFLSTLESKKKKRKATQEPNNSITTHYIEMANSRFCYSLDWCKKATDEGKDGWN